MLVKGQLDWHTCNKFYDYWQVLMFTWNTCFDYSMHPRYTLY